MNFTLGVLLLSMFVTWQGQGVNKAKNVQEFNALCRLFRIAVDNREKKPQELLGDIWDKIIAVSAKKEKFANESTDLRVPFVVEVEGFGKIELRRQDSLDQIHLRAKTAAVQIGRLKAAANSLKSDTIKIAGTVLQSLDKALAGELMKGLDKISTVPPGMITTGTTTVARNAACIAKKGGETAYAGVSLTNDLACLCVSVEGSNTKEICGFDNAGAGSFWKNADTGQGTALEKEWKKVYEACKAETYLGTRLTPENIASAIQHFLAILGAQASTESNGKGAKCRWVLGLPDADGSAAACLGDHSAYDDICVNYGNAAGNKLEKIDWLDNLENARTGLLQIQENERKATTMYDKACQFDERTNEELVRLNISETLDLEQPKPATNQRNQNSRPNPTTEDKATAQESTSVNIASIPRIILPWTLLI